MTVRGLGAEPAKPPLGLEPLTQRLPAVVGKLLGRMPGGAGRPVAMPGSGRAQVTSRRMPVATS